MLGETEAIAYASTASEQLFESEPHGSNQHTRGMPGRILPETHKVCCQSSFSPSYVLSELSTAAECGQRQILSNLCVFKVGTSLGRRFNQN